MSEHTPDRLLPRIDVGHSHVLIFLKKGMSADAERRSSEKCRLRR